MIDKLGNFFWDTSEDPVNFPEEIKKEFFYLSINNRNVFTDWLGKISKKYSNNIEWWIKIPATRDPFISNLYKSILIIEILKNRKLSKRIKFLTVDSKGLFFTILKFKIFDKKKLRLKEKKNKNLSLINYLLFSFLTFLLIKFFSKKRSLKFSSKITLIDTFSDYRFKKDDLVYPGLEEALNKKSNSKFYFVPNFFPSKNIFNVIRNIFFFSKKNYIFKENFLSFFNYISCVRKTLSKKLKNNSAKFNNVNLSAIINEELNSNKHFYSEFLARVNLAFVEKLKEQNLDVKKVINRFENQPMDKAWNYGFRSHFPSAEVIGFQGFFYYPHFPHQSPTTYEQKAKVVPKKIIVTGKAFKKPRQEFDRKTKVVLGPSLGKQNFLKKIKKAYDFKFVLALCGVKALDEKMLQWSLGVLKKNQNLTLVIKPHPILSINNILNKYSQKIRDRITMSYHSVDKLLEKSEVIISSGPTSIVLESLVYGCKLFYLVLDPNDSLIIKKIPKSKKYLTFINNESDLLKEMVKFNKKRFIKKANNLNYYFFTKKNNKNIKIFF